ncbi:unannotated protein [freshwater metagenome]|uniref:Unannotated protein n=1 Tax=freshwater metagenome TaxID=449393 RepID=A0A6J7U2Y9_9ZZZZ
MGSSRTKIFGCITKALPIARRCCSPPLKVEIARLRKGARAKRSRISSTRLRITSGATFRDSMPKTSSSSTVSVTNPVLGFWPTMPMRCANSPGRTSCVDMPSTITSPASIPPVWWGTRPFINRRSEDFPVPVEPITRTISPSSIEKVKPSKTVFVDVGYTRETFENLIMR